MANDLFDSPGSTTGIKWDDHKGQLVLIWSHEVKPFEYEGENKDVIEADVVVLDAPGGPIEYRRCIIFPRVMQGQLRNNVGRNKPNLGRVGKGEAKPRQTAPWVLIDPDESDKRMAVEFLTSNATAVPAQPAAAVTDDEPPF